MAKKKEVKNKANKSKQAKYKKVKKSINGLPDKAKISLAVTAFILVAAFLIVCYFNPAIYENFLNLFKKQEESHISSIVGDDVYVDKLSDVEIHFVDVGQGDSIVIKLPDETVMLIDAYNDNKLLAYLQNKLKITTIDYFVVTHSDRDHIDAADIIFRNFEVKKVFRPYILYNGDYDFDLEFNKGNTEANSNVYRDFLTYLLEETYVDGNEVKSCEWEFFNYESDFSKNIHYQNKEYTFTFDFLTPAAKVEDIYYGNDTNNYSPIIKFSYCGTDVLFTGDAETATLEELLSTYTSQDDFNYLDVEVLKLGHHGSKTSTTTPFLDLVKPEYAIASCGLGNSYGHPHKEVLDMLSLKNIALYRTDLCGNIVLNISTEDYEFLLDNNNVLPEDMFTAPS